VSSDINKDQGLLWNQLEDTINIPGFDKVKICSSVTKRDVLQRVA